MTWAEESLGYFGRILRIRDPWQTTSHFWGGFPTQFSKQRRLSSLVQRTGCAVRQPQRWHLPSYLSSLPAPGKPRGQLPLSQVLPSGPAMLAALSPQARPWRASARAVPGSSTSWSWQPTHTATALLRGEGEDWNTWGQGRAHLQLHLKTQPSLPRRAKMRHPALSPQGRDGGTASMACLRPLASCSHLHPGTPPRGIYNKLSLKIITFLELLLTAAAMHVWKATIYAQWVVVSLPQTSAIQFKP